MLSLVHPHSSCNFCEAILGVNHLHHSAVTRTSCQGTTTSCGATSDSLRSFEANELGQ